MILRRWSLVLIALVPLGCAASAPRARTQPVPAEALTDASSIRLRCEDPEGVIAGRALCVLKDMPRVAIPQR